MRANAGCLGSVPASQELPGVVAVFHAQRAHKTSEFLDPIEQTDVVRLDADRSVGSSIFHGKKAEEIQTVRIASSLPFVPCRSTWGESCPISLPAAPGGELLRLSDSVDGADDLNPRKGLRRRSNRDATSEAALIR
jgi:hypothetical protein